MSSQQQSPGRKPGKNPFQVQQPTQALLAAQKAQQKRAKKGGISDYAYHIVIGVFLALCAAALYSTLTQDRRKLSEVPVIDDLVIDNHNGQDYAYQLGRNEFFQDWFLSDAKSIINNQVTTKQQLPRCATSDESTIIPERYNFRESHANCARPIINQGNCSSSYAVASASSLSDRFCQQSEGKQTLNLSPQQALSCDKKRSQGCTGGSVTGFLDFAKKEGVVEESCFAYTGQHDTACPTNLGDCKRHFTQDYCVISTEEGIKREILKNGPVVSVVPVFKDFLVYKQGVYNVPEGASRLQGGQAIKLIGWDQNEEGNYWIAENSWGQTWGLNGLANIGCGQKQLYIEDFTIAVSPKIVKEVEKTPEPESPAQNTQSTEKVDLDAQ